MKEDGDPVLTRTDVVRFEHSSADGDVAAVLRLFFDWLERRSSAAVVRKELLDLVTSVANELAAPRPIGFTVTAEDGGANMLLQFLVHDAEEDLPSRLGRGLAAVDRMADQCSVVVLPIIGDRHVLLDVLLPSR